MFELGKIKSEEFKSFLSDVFFSYTGFKINNNTKAELPPWLQSDRWQGPNHYS